MFRERRKDFFFSEPQKEYQRDENKVYRLSGFQVDEVSFVTSGANRKPLILVKRAVGVLKGAIPYASFEKDTTDHDSEYATIRERLMEHYTDSSEGIEPVINWEEYKKCFLWYDSAYEKDMYSYRFPVVDMIDGKPKMVKSALEQSAKQVSSGIQYFAEGDYEKVIDRIKRHYKDFDEEMPEEMATIPETIVAETSKNSLFIEEEERIVSGPVIIPEKRDSQGDKFTHKAVRKGAHNYLARLAKESVKLGVMHKDYNRRMELVESYTAPVDMVFPGRVIKKGTWMVTFKVHDDETWAKVKNGELREFSFIGTGSGVCL